MKNDVLFPPGELRKAKHGKVEGIWRLSQEEQ